MKDLVLYIHGKGGSAAESARYGPLFPGCEIAGLDYRSTMPWEAGDEIHEAAALCGGRRDIVLIANSIGAYFSMCAGIDSMVRRAYFISPIVDMERLILNMMARANVTEAALAARGAISTAFGEDLSWEYLSWVRAHPVAWNAPTRILYGGRDGLTSRETIEAFAGRQGARLTVMEDGEHWFHTPAQLRFLDRWIAESEGSAGIG